MTTSHLSDWDQFYALHVSRYFKLPLEARVLEARESRDSFVGRSILVRFRLPGTKAPADWVRVIATSSGIGAHKKTDFLYDAGGDVYRVEYLPRIGLYEAERAWD